MPDNFGFRLGVEGEKDFKRALSDINKDMKLLGSELKLVTSEFLKNDSSVEALTARNDVLNKQIDAQKDKIKTLKAALDNAASSFGENDSRTKNWQIKLNEAEAALHEMDRELKSNVRELESAENATDDEAKAIMKMGDASDDSSDKLKVLGGALKGTVAAITAVSAVTAAAVKELWNLANGTAEAGDAIDKNSQKIGISAESYQEWDYVFQRCGADVDNLQAGMKTLNNVIADAANGSDNAAQKLSAVGLSIEDLNGKSSDEQLSIVISALQDMEAGAERSAAANDLFGRSASEMGAVLNMTAEETKALKDEANDYGMIMSNEAVAASAEFENSLTKLNGTIAGVKNRMTGELLPGLTEVIDGFTELVNGNKDGAQQIKAGLDDVMNKASEIIPQAVELFSTVVEAVADSAPTILDELFDSVLTVLPRLLSTFFSDVMPKLVKALTTMLPKLVTSTLQVVKSLISSIAKSLPQLMRDLSKVVTEIVKILTDPKNIALLVGAGAELIAGLAEGIVTGVFELIKSFPDIVSNIWNSFVDLFDGSAKLDGVNDALSEVGDSFEELGDRARDALQQVEDKMTSMSAGFSTIDDLSGRLHKLIEDGTIDASEQAEVKTIVDILSEKVPDFKTTWNDLVTEDANGNLSLQGSADKTIGKINEVIAAYKQQAAQAALNATVADLMEKSQEIALDRKQAEAGMNEAQRQYSEWLAGWLDMYHVTESQWHDFLNGTLDADIDDTTLASMQVIWSEMQDKGFMEWLASAQLSIEGLDISQQELQGTTESYMDILNVMKGDYKSNFAATLEAIKLGFIDQQTVLDDTGLSWDELNEKAKATSTAAEQSVEDAWKNMTSTLEGGSIDWKKYGDDVAFVVGNHEYKLNELKNMSKEQFKDLSAHFNTSDWTSWGDDTGKVTDNVAKAIGTMQVEIGKESKKTTKNIHGITADIDKNKMGNEASSVWQQIVWSFGGERGSWETFYGIGKNTLEGLIAGLTDPYTRRRLNTVQKQIAESGGDIYASTNEIRSPSRRFKRFGIYDIEGLIEGHDEMRDQAVASMKRLADDMFNVDYSLPAVSLPDMSTSTFTASAGASGYAAAPISVTVQFGDVSMASDMDIADVAHRVSDIIVSDIITERGRFR